MPPSPRARRAPTPRRALSHFVALLGAALLTACGGGDATPTPNEREAPLASRPTPALAQPASLGSFVPRAAWTMAPAASSHLRVVTNLDLRTWMLAADVVFDPLDADTFSKVHSLPLFDARGNAMWVGFYFQRIDAFEQWRVHVLANGVEIGDPDGRAMHFGPDGECLAGCEAERVDVPAVPLHLGGLSEAIEGLSIDFSGSTAHASLFEVTTSEQDGWSRGRLVSVTPAGSAGVTLHYDNGQRRSWRLRPGAGHAVAARLAR